MYQCINLKMDSPNELKKVSFFRGLFEIKRPSKSVQSATLPRTNSKKSIDDDDVSKDRLFVRHNTYRSRTRKNKYKKENSKKQLDEKLIEKGENSVKQICQQFEENRLVQANKTKDNIKINKEKEESPETVIGRVLGNSETQLILLKKIHENAEVKKRIYDKNAKQTREKKIQSFVEAENEEEAEEYRKSLINEMDKELAQMREDGFLDEDENVLINGSQQQIEETDEVFYNDDNTFLTKMRLNKRNIDALPLSSDPIKHTYSDEKEEEIIHDKEDNNAERKECEATLIDKSSNEFGENLDNDLKNGCEAINGIFSHNESKTFDFFHDMNTIEQEIPTKQEEVRTVELCDKSDVENMRELMKQELATSSNNEALYEYIEIPNENNPQSPFYIFAPVSNRSTIYSTTTQESSVIDDDDDDEGIEICRTKDGEKVYHNVRRETFSDDKGIIRIERVADAENTPFIPEEAPISLSRSNSTTPIKRLDFIIDEIKSTERKYVEDLTKVVKIYKPYIENNTPPNLKNYEGYLFGNFEKIYRRQKKFLQAIENCQDVDQIVQCFIDHELLFELYPTYFRNKPKSDTLIKEFHPIIKEMQEKFEERLDFSAYLLTPVQRLGKYILFLENIEKQLEKLDLPVENTQAALDIVRDEMSKGNDSVAIESIEHSPISKMDYGSFKMREKFNIIKPRKVEAAMVFLFTNVVVFSVTDTRSLETFYYYDSIKMNDLRIATFDDLTMHLTDFTKSKKKQNTSRYTYILESKSEKIWKTWKDAIEKILWDQLVKAKENSLNNTVLHRRKYKINRNRIKSAGSSVFYCE